MPDNFYDFMSIRPVDLFNHNILTVIVRHYKTSDHSRMKIIMSSFTVHCQHVNHTVISEWDFFIGGGGGGGTHIQKKLVHFLVINVELFKKQYQLMYIF